MHLNYRKKRWRILDNLRNKTSTQDKHCFSRGPPVPSASVPRRASAFALQNLSQQGLQQRHISMFLGFVPHTTEFGRQSSVLIFAGQPFPTFSEESPPTPDNFRDAFISSFREENRCFYSNFVNRNLYHPTCSKFLIAFYILYFFCLSTASL